MKCTGFGLILLPLVQSEQDLAIVRKSLRGQMKILIVQHHRYETRHFDGDLFGALGDKERPGKAAGINPYPKARR